MKKIKEALKDLWEIIVFPDYELINGYDPIPMQIVQPVAPYTYKGELIGVIDANTILVYLDLGLDTSIKRTLKLNRIKADVSAETKQAVWEALFSNDFMIHTIKKDGEYFAEVWALLEGEFYNLNDWLVTKGLAKVVG